MVRPIMRDMMFLACPSQPATPQDMPAAQDLMDTLRAHEEHCVGMAANMIGVHRRIIAVSAGFVNLLMINPIITKKSGPYEAEEGCLSLAGVRKTTRYQRIEVEYLDAAWKKQRRAFEGYTAQIIQHEVDHCDGVLI